MRHQIENIDGGSFSYTVLVDVPAGGDCVEAAKAELARRGMTLDPNMRIVTYGHHNTRAEWEAVHGPQDPWKYSFADYYPPPRPTGGGRNAVIVHGGKCWWAR